MILIAQYWKIELFIMADGWWSSGEGKGTGYLTWGGLNEN
jgi:hypothetical protein